MKPLGTIQVDVDDLPVIARHWNITGQNIERLLDKTIINFIELFETLNIKATFFLVGEDLNNKRTARIFKHLANSEHEIASHSYTHPSGLLALSPKQQEKEIIELKKKNYYRKNWY